MTFKVDGERLASFTASLEGLSINRVMVRTSYGHIGATISDTILQAGLNYKTVVKPRVDQLAREFPEGKTTSGFINLIAFYGLSRLVRWDHPEKPRRIMDLTWFIANEGIETEGELSAWLRDSANCRQLLNLNGVGPKTVDYLKMLVGISSIPVDRHIRSFVRLAGLRYTRYDDVQRVVEIAADVLAVNRSSFDKAIWSYFAAAPRGNLHADPA